MCIRDSSVTNDAQSIEDSGNATASLIDSEELGEGIKKAAEKNGLQINTEAATILASLDDSDTETMAAAIKSMETNISFLDEDYVQAITPDTIVYDSEWQTLTKVTGGDLEYADSNDVFDASSPPQSRSKVYVNFKEQTIFADVFTKVTRAAGAGNSGVEKNFEIENEWRTGTASVASALNSDPPQPIVATEDQGLGTGWGSFSVPFGTNIDASSTFSTMKKNKTTLQDACAVSSCGEGDYWTVKQNFIEEFNNDINDASSFGGDSGLTYNKTTDTLTGVTGSFTTINATTITADTMQTSGTGVPTFTSASNIIFDAANAVVLQRTPLRLGSYDCLLYTSPSPRDRTRSRMPSSA